jgi:hypothetical protein
LLHEIVGEAEMRVLLTDRFCDRAKSTSVQTDYFHENVSGLALRASSDVRNNWRRCLEDVADGDEWVPVATRVVQKRYDEIVVSFTVVQN